MGELGRTPSNNESSREVPASLPPKLSFVGRSPWERAASCEGNWHPGVASTIPVHAGRSEGVIQ